MIAAAIACGKPDAVRAGRAAGLPWQVIGAALGVSKQSAQAKYAPLIAGSTTTEAI
jgi:hypothetical protein